MSAQFLDSKQEVQQKSYRYCINREIEKLQTADKDQTVPIFCEECIHAMVSQLLQLSQIPLTGSWRYGRQSAQLVHEVSVVES